MFASGAGTFSKRNLWEICRDYDVHISVTVYPVRLDYLAMEEKAKGIWGAVVYVIQHPCR